MSNWCGCAQHYYDNNVTVACSKCQYTCDSCLFGSNCSSCSAARFRKFDAINQFCVCEVGYFDDKMN